MVINPIMSKIKMNHTMGFDFDESAKKRGEDVLTNSVQSTKGSSPRRRTSPGKSPSRKKT